MFALWFDSIRIFFQQLAESQQPTPIALHVENRQKANRLPVKK